MTAYRCPNCGADDAWNAEYYEAQKQSCTLEVKDGKLIVDEYTGRMDSFDDSSTDNDAYSCGNCDYRIEVGDFVFKPREYTLEHYVENVEEDDA